MVSKNFTRLTHIIKLKENERSFYARVTRERRPVGLTEAKLTKNRRFFVKELKVDRKSEAFRKAERKGQLSAKVKLERAYDECLGIRSRRRT